MMSEWTVQLSQLMAQRKVLLCNFCCYKQNNINHTQRLLTLVRLIAQGNNSCLIGAQNTADILGYLRTENNDDKEDAVLILSLKLMVTPSLQCVVFPALLQSEHIWLQVLAFKVARLLGDNLTFTFELIHQAHFVKPLFSRDIELEALLLPHVLWHLYYRKTLNDYLATFVPRYKTLQAKEASLNNLSALSWLYIEVLSDTGTRVEDIVAQFIAQDYLASSLFELYVTSLNEHEVTQLINQLSADNALIPTVIHAMALSGYTKFIPFLAQYLQQPCFVFDAFDALKILLGDVLDTIIPLHVQFKSEDEERATDLAYYGAKILNAWQQRLPLLALVFKQKTAPEGSEGAHEHPEPLTGEVEQARQILNGEKLTDVMNNTLLCTGSQKHRYVAMLHQQHLSLAPYVHHAYALEAC